MKLKLVGPQQAAAIICAAWAVVPVCRRPVCVAACSATRTTQAAVPVRAVFAGGRSLCVWPCTCLAIMHSINLVVKIDVKREIVHVRRPGE